MEREPTNAVRRDREVRDIFNKLRKKYNSDTVREFIQRNYFIYTPTVYDILQRVDNEPVTDPSMIYEAAMDENFHL